MAPRIAPQSVTALRTIASNTGWTSVGELEITRRISLVAVCCSRASPNDRLRLSISVFRCACEPVVRSGPLKGSAQFSQNLAVGRFSCWHRGHFISEPPNHRAGEDPNRRARVALRLPHGQGKCGKGPRVCSFARDLRVLIHRSPGDEAHGAERGRTDARCSEHGRPHTFEARKARCGRPTG